MQEWHTVDRGYKQGFFQYGAGLMIKNVNGPEPKKTPPANLLASYIGHYDETGYGFMSDNGYFP